VNAVQIDIFGSETAMGGQQPVAGHRADDGLPTCWDDCELIGTMPLSYRGRQFFICQHPGKPQTRCFKGDLACSKARLRSRQPRHKPVGPGWEDY